MKITEIQVTAGRVFQDPNDPGTTLSCDVSLKATTDPNKACPDTADVKALQATAELYVDGHCGRLIRSLANRRSIQQVNDRLSDVMDRADEDSGELKQLASSLHLLRKTPSIFNEPERKA